MSYKKFNDLQNLYEGVVSESNEIDEYTELVYNVIIAEMVYRGHSESVIKTYCENISEEQIIEKLESFFSLEEFNLNEEQTDLLFSFYQEQQQLINEGLKQKAGQYGWQILQRLKGSSSKLKNQITSALKGFGKGKGTKQLELNLKGAKDGPGLLKKLQNLKTSTGDKLKNFKSKFDKKVTTKSKTLLGPDGKPLQTTKTVNPINKKNAAIVGTGIVGGAVLSSGGDKKDDSKKVPVNKTENGKSSGLSFGDAIKASETDAGKDLIKSIQTPKKKNAAGVEMTGSGTKDDPWISKAVKGKDKYIPMTDPKNPHYYKGIEKGLPNKADWLKKTSNSPAAKSGAFNDDQRWEQQLKHREWQDKNNRGAFKVKKEKPKSDTYTNKMGAFLNNAKVGDVKNKSRHTKVTSVMDMESYDAKGEVFDEGAGKLAAKVAKGVKKIVKGKLPKKAAYGKGQEGSFITRQKEKLAKQTGYNPGKDYGKSYNPKNPSGFKSKAEISSERAGDVQWHKKPFEGKLKTKTPTEKASRQQRVKEMENAGKAKQTSYENFDAYDLVLDYIMETKQAFSIEEANYIMLEMDQNTIHEIVVEQKKSLDEGLKTAIGIGLLATPWAMSELEKRWNPIKNKRKEYQNKKATEYEKKSGTTKEDGYFR